MKGKKILIVEDEVVFRSVLRNYLKSFDVITYTASNGQEALDIINAVEHLDLILCDLSMPVMSGESLMQKLVEMKCQIPVIVISGTNRISDLDRMLRLGVKDALLKPIVDFDDVKETITRNLYPDIVETTTRLSAELSHIQQMIQHEKHDILPVLLELQPKVNQILANYKINYRQLKDINKTGLLFDLAELSDKQIGFYCLDIEYSSGDGVMAALLLRVAFNELLQTYLNSQSNRLFNISEMLKQLNTLLMDLGIKGQFPILLGYFHTVSKTIVLASAGLNVKLKTENKEVKLSSSAPLGSLQPMTYQQIMEKGTDWQCKIWDHKHRMTLMFNSLVEIL